MTRYNEPFVHQFDQWMSRIERRLTQLERRRRVASAPGPEPGEPLGVGAGLAGTGTQANPVRVSTSGVWGAPPLDGLGSDTTIGQVIYVDANNQLRAAPLPEPEPEPEDDTGWLPLTVLSPWLYNTGAGVAPPPAIRRIGKEVRLTGEVWGGTSGTAALDIPAELRPPNRDAWGLVRFHSTAGGDVRAIASYNNTGQIFIGSSTGVVTASPGYTLSGIGWWLD